MDMDLVRATLMKRRRRQALPSALNSSKPGDETNVEMRQLVSPFSAFATVATDERNVSVVSAPANGVVSKLFVNAPQQQVKAGGAGATVDPAMDHRPAGGISQFVSLAMPH